MTTAMEHVLKRRQARLDRHRPFKRVEDHVERARIMLARGDRHLVITSFETYAKRGDMLVHLTLSVEANGLSPARAKKLTKASRFYRRVASEIAVLLWGDVEDVQK